MKKVERAVLQHKIAHQRDRILHKYYKFSQILLHVVFVWSHEKESRKKLKKKRIEIDKFI